jgi:hypothetical protein
MCDATQPLAQSNTDYHANLTMLIMESKVRPLDNQAIDVNGFGFPVILINTIGFGFGICEVVTRRESRRGKLQILRKEFKYSPMC